MSRGDAFRPARAIRIHCPVASATLKHLLSGEAAALEADETLGRMLAIIRGDNPLGDFGLYKGVVEMSPGIESFVPTEAASPTSGAAGEVSLCAAIILTTYVDDEAPEDQVMHALAEIVAAHPWEVPVVEIHPSTLLVKR